VKSLENFNRVRTSKAFVRVSNFTQLQITNYNYNSMHMDVLQVSSH